MAGNIGIIGRARVGKDTVGKWLVDNRGYERVGFADLLKLAAWKIDPITRADFFGPQRRWSDNITGEGSYERAKDEIPEVRRFLQAFGAAIRDIDEDFWLRAALKKVTAANEAGSPVVITDVRYPNEAESLRRAGFHLIYVSRPGVPHLDHESEGALTSADADYSLSNCGSLSGLYIELQAIVDDVYNIESRRQYGRSY
jgi:hypothetical protein